MDIENRINQIEQELQALKSSESIPLENYEAIKDKLNAVSGNTNTTNASTETQAVDEAGTGTYNVAKPMDGFITISFGGRNYKVPYYN